MISSRARWPSRLRHRQQPRLRGAGSCSSGAFKNADSVNALVSKLRAAGYSAQTSPRTPGRADQLVFIGPDVSKAKLQGMQSRISQMTGLSGSVVAYNP